MATQLVFDFEMVKNKPAAMTVKVIVGGVRTFVTTPGPVPLRKSWMALCGSCNELDAYEYVWASGRNQSFVFAADCDYVSFYVRNDGNEKGDIVRQFRAPTNEIYGAMTDTLAKLPTK